MKREIKIPHSERTGGISRPAKAGTTNRVKVCSSGFSRSAFRLAIGVSIGLWLSALGSFADTYYATNHLPSAPAAGEAGSTAIHRSSNAIVAWADGYTNLLYGTDVDAEWMTPDKALGPAEGVSFEVVSLGRGGRITLTFPNGIGDRLGADFTVFENSIGDTFLEQAWVEVSSDGTNFVRFPNYSDTPYSIGAFGELYTGWIYGLAGKYRQGYGTPFDLEELRIAYHAQLSGNTDFSPAFATALTNGFPLLNLNNITHVRLMDIIGDGSALDARGSVIYDPYATVISAGFDLDAIGVLNESFVPYTDWAEFHSVSTNGQGDADGDTVIDFQEYMMGGDPNLGTSAPVPTLGTSSNGVSVVIMEYALSRHASGTSWVEASDDLSDWTNAVPQSTEQWSDPDFIYQKFYFPSDPSKQFFRLVFEGE